MLTVTLTKIGVKGISKEKVLSCDNYDILNCKETGERNIQFWSGDDRCSPAESLGFRSHCYQHMYVENQSGKTIKHESVVNQLQALKTAISAADDKTGYEKGLNHELLYALVETNVKLTVDDLAPIKDKIYAIKTRGVCSDSSIIEQFEDENVMRILDKFKA